MRHFFNLMGGPELSAADMTAFTNFMNTVVYMPNPYQNLDRTLPDSIALPDVPGQTGNPNNGQSLFLNLVFGTSDAGQTCASCHTFPGLGTNFVIRPPKGEVMQPMKVSQLRNMYQKTNVNFNGRKSVSVNGFGFSHDGTIGGLYDFVHRSTFGIYGKNAQYSQDVDAFQMAFDTGMAPAVGYSRTLNSGNVASGSVTSDWNTLQSQAGVNNADLIALGTINGVFHGLLYQPSTQNYETDTTGLGPFTQTQLAAFVQNGDTLTIMGVPLGSGVRMALDRTLDGILNGDATKAGKFGR